MTNSGKERDVTTAATETADVVVDIVIIDLSKKLTDSNIALLMPNSETFSV